MNEIKFKAWDKERERIVHVIEIDFACKTVSVSEKEDYKNEYDLNFEDIELIQFTGLHDKSGNKLFQGDIIQGLPYNSEIFWNENRLRWEERHDVIDADGKKEFTRMMQIFHRKGIVDCKIIGNVWENPELLKEV